MIRFRHIIQTVLLQNFKKPFPQWQLHDFFCWGAKGGLPVQRVLKKLIKLIERNECLTLAISSLSVGHYELCRDDIGDLLGSPNHL